MEWWWWDTDPVPGYCCIGGLRIDANRILSDVGVITTSSRVSMADFDAIYEENQLEEQQQQQQQHQPYQDQTLGPVPEPIIIRGAGNMTV